MVDKKDPICGMTGTIKLYGHYFCSNNCIKEYEKKHNPKRPWNRTTLFKVTLYTLIIVILIAFLIFLQIKNYMILFMGFAFVVVSILKLLDWKGFAKAFAMYDLIAMKSKFYAFIYPLIELALGFAYLFSFQIEITAIVTFIIMTVGAVGVGRNLLSKNPVKCACLGTLIKIPLTKFTLFEDITMAVMALMILFL